VDYRDEREVLRARVDDLQEKLARAEETIAELRGHRKARRGQVAKHVALVGALTLLVGFGAVTLLARHPANRAALPSPAAAVPFVAVTRAPMFARIDGGAVVDPIVWGRSEGKACFAAFAVGSGARLWLTCPYAESAAVSGRAAVVGNRLLVDFERKLDAFDVTSGAKLWTTPLDERTFEYCLRPDGSLRIALELGGATYVVSPETGQLTPSLRVYDCQGIWNDEAWRDRQLPGQHVAAHGSLPFRDYRNPVPVADGVVPEMAVDHGGRTIVLGYARPGVHAPIAAAFGEMGVRLWKRVLPPEDPPLADAGGPAFATLDEHRLCAPYPGHDGYRLGCWEAATGTALWDVPVKVPLGGFYGVAMTERHLILVHAAGGFGVFDGATGAWLRDIP